MRLNMQKAPVQIVFTVLVCAMLSMVQNSYAQGAPTPAGKVVFAMGTPHAVNASGVSRNLAKGDPIYSGDHLLTGRGRLQVAMVDGAFISVQPNSEYVLDTYHFDGKTDGTEQATYRLVKGGVRAVTGLIGRVNKDAYKVNTAVATIGIRGTGHNTRICAGDCGNVKDGLYHNTWEGITYVVNDVDTAEVPAGQGVYVQSIDMPIVPLNQAPGVTAVVTKTQQVKDEQKQDQQEEDQTTLVAAGDQRTSTGTQVVVSGPSSTPSNVVSGLVLGGIHPDDTNTSGVGTVGFSNASVFLDPTSNGVIAILGLDDSTPPVRAFGTIDPNAALGGDDPAAVAEAGSLLDLADQTNKDTFLSNPAQLAENTTMGDIGWGRWANGYFLGVNANGETFLFDLTGNQSMHYIYGPDPGTIPSSGTAFYNFIGGTQSTSLSGDTIGNGVTDGAIYVDFGSSTAGLRMNVDHNGNVYFVNGKLTMDTGGGSGLSDYAATASTAASGSACNPGCTTTLEGGFAGSAIAGHPADIGLSYDIQESDPIMGVAAFATDNVFGSASMGISTYTFPYPGGTIPSIAFFTDNSGFGYNVYLVNDSNGKFIGHVVNDTGSNYTWLYTIDLYSLLDNSNSSVTSLMSGVLNSLQGTVINDFMSNPAQVLESVTAGDVSMGRWGNGKILFADNNNPGFTLNMQNDQSYHFINGPDPGALPASGVAYYKFTGGTQSTTASGVANASGVALGSGVTDGTIMVDFLGDSGSLDMNVMHGNKYHVNGPLILDAMNNVLFDGGGTMASTTASGSACNPNCVTYFYGGLLGPKDSTSGLPGNLGLYYEIHEQVSATDTTVDPIMGVAAFGFDKLAGSIASQPFGFVAVQPDQANPGLANITNGTNAIMFTDVNSGDGIGAIITVHNYDPITMTDTTSRGFGTIDLNAMQLSDNQAARTELSGLVAGAGPTAVADFESNPASVAEFTTDGTIGYGRWANGKVLTYDNSSPAEVVNLTGNQSIHFIYGPDLASRPSTGTATYNFIGGTQSTSVSGATIGNGVTSGDISVDFGAASANLSMTVDHGSSYAVAGPLALDPTGTGIYDNGSVIATGGTGPCISGCGVTIDGGFAGPINTAGNPSYIGIAYDIQESDQITGVAGFGN